MKTKPTFETTVATKDHIKPALEKLAAAFKRSKAEGKEARIGLSLWREAMELQIVALVGDTTKDQDVIVGLILGQEKTVVEHVKAYPCRLGLSIQVTP